MRVSAYPELRGMFGVCPGYCGEYMAYQFIYKKHLTNAAEYYIIKNMNNTHTKRGSDMNIKKGTEVYYGGDMANSDGFGTVVAVRNDMYNTVMIKMEDGRDINIPTAAFSPTYSGNGSTRFVTRAAYNAWHQSRMEEFMRCYGVTA